MSFEKINYKGVEQFKDVDTSTKTVQYRHIYRSNYLGTLKKHACFEWGHWCWKQARERPDKAITYLFKRINDAN